ncbi:MAG: hypothetical protein WA989_08540 [Henriciella sp.]|uniref:hypothetical protein n=1 Tax=Henriciella sp. TaxID=1968823 RepID=UPI003C713F69
MPEQIPETISFSATNRRYYWLAFIGIGFMFLMILIARSGHADPEWVADTFAVIGAFAAIIGALQAVFQRAWLKLDREGFESSELKGIGRISWDEISEIRLHVERTRGIATEHHAAFDFLRGENPLLNRVNHFFRKGAIQLTENYRVPAAELVALMNAFRTRAIVANEA